MTQLAQLLEHLPDVDDDLDDRSFPTPSPAALRETLRYLESTDSAVTIAADPYWPKWDSPWWRMTLMYELGLSDRIPSSAVGRMTKAVSQHYIDFFPARQEDAPGVDFYREVVCHCALGTIYQVLSACGVDVDREIPWARRWFIKYQLPDGGLNCDESAYLKAVPRSSVVSTLPALEAILGREPMTSAEESFLDRGASYLIQRCLFRSPSKGMRVIDEAWLLPTFPRFYHYDVLRGLNFLVRWARWRGTSLPADAVTEAVSIIAGRLDSSGLVCVGRRAFDGHDTLRLDHNGQWGSQRVPASTFPLLDEVSQVGSPSLQLTREWRATISGLRQLAEDGFLS